MRADVQRSVFSRQPLTLLALAFAAGISVAHAITLSLRLLLACGACYFTLALFSFVKQKLTHTTVFVLGAFVCVGALVAVVEQGSVRLDSLGRFYESGRIESGVPVEVTGVLARGPEVAPDGLYLTLRVERVGYKAAETVAVGEVAATGMVELFAPTREASARAAYEALELRRGARLRVLVRLERDAEFRNPGGSSLPEYLARRGFAATGVVKSPLLVERLDDERVFVPLVWLDGWREALRARLAELFAPETAGVLQAALLGNRHGLSRATAERFRAGGTFHVLVISGLHISFIGWLAFVVLRRLTKRRVWQFALTVLLLWAYAVAVGAEASVVRAALMFTLMALAPLVGRRATSLNTLGATALTLLVWRPVDLFDPSFQLTFMSVLGIVVLGWPLLERARAVGAWRPTRATPHPPACPRWFRTLGETLYWRERVWQRETARTVYSYRLFKCPAAAKLEHWRVQGLLRHVCAAVVISAAVQVCLLPLLVIYFHRLSVASLLLNVFVGALLAALALVALVALALSCVSMQLALPLVWLGEWLNWLMLHSVDPFARAHIASVRLPAYHGWAAMLYALYYVPLAGLIVALAHWQPLAPPTTRATDDHLSATTSDRLTIPISDYFINARRLTLTSLAFVALLCIVVAHPFSTGRADGRLRVDFLDVGQGDAALVTLPDGTTLLVDAGGRANFDRRTRTDEQRRTAADDENAAAQSTSDEADDTFASERVDFARDARGIGDAVVSEYLWWRGLARVDYVLATHAHADHMEGLNDVARNFNARAAFVARAPAYTDEYAQLAATLRQEGTPVYLLGRGARLRFDAVTVEVLWPSADANIAASSGNDDSLVLRLRYGTRVFMLTGDIESRAEAALLRANEDLHCDVIKVAHHGSRTSSTGAFVAATRPQLAIISVGRASPFGHPDVNVVARWRAQGTTVLQTGRHGTITVSTDGHDLRVETYAHDERTRGDE